MAHSVQARKRIRQNVKRAARNRPVRSRATNAVRDARIAIENGDGDAADLVRAAQSALDRAARRGVIHPNSAARRKSRLDRRLAPIPAAHRPSVRGHRALRYAAPGSWRRCSGLTPAHRAPRRRDRRTTG